MLSVFKSNGLRFYPVLADGQTPNPVSFGDLPFEFQSVAGVHQPEVKKGYQVVDFSDVSYVQVWSDAVPNLGIYDKNTNFLANLAFTEIGEMDGVKVYQVEINWSNVLNIGDGIYIIVNNGTDYFRSEPIYEPQEGIIKLIYSNNNDSFDYGLYSFCGSMVAYVKARLHDFEIPVDRIVWEDNLGQNRTLRQSKRNLKKFETCKLPYYIQEILVYAFSHDKISIGIKRGGFTVLDKYEVFENNSLKISKPELLYNAFDSNIVLALKDSFVRRIPKERNEDCDPPLHPPVPNIITISDTNPSDTVAEEENPLNIATYVISRVQGDLNTTTVTISINGIDASDAILEYQNGNGNWFTIVNSLVSIEPNQNEVQIRLVAVDDALIEGTENFQIVISNPTNNASIQNDTVSGTIIEVAPVDGMISLHFSGNYAGNNHSYTFSQKLINLSVQNILSLANSYTIKYSDTHIIPNWTSINSQSVAQIQTAIDNGTNDYLLHFEVQSYTVLDNAVLSLKYLTFNPAPSVQVVLLNAVYQSVWVGVPPNTTLQLASVASVNSPISTFYFGFKTSANDDFTVYDLDLAALNALLISTSDNIERVITIYAAYESPNLSDIVTLTFS